MNAPPLFSTGSARGGTGLVTRMLSVSPKVESALDPFLALFKLFRNRIAEGMCDPQAALHDYYFRGETIALLDRIQNASLDEPWDDKGRTDLVADLKKRARLSSGDLVASMDALAGKTFRELFSSALSLIERTRKKEGLKWVGLHENWTIEFFPPLARAFPEAKFMIVLRDPRAVVHSNLNVKDAFLRGHVLSYARALRKLMALGFYYQKLSLFRDRLRIVRYEDLILEPETVCKSLCDFLGVDFQQEMLDTNRYIEPSTGEVYNGFSSFETRAEGFSPHRIDRWKGALNDGSRGLVDFVCGPEMGLFNYPTSRIGRQDVHDPKVLEVLIGDDRGPKAWRTDFGSPPEEYDFEMFRRAMLCSPRVEWEEKLVRKNFLFREIYEGLIHAAR